MFCRTCGRGPADARHFDERSLCPVCVPQADAGTQYTELFCTRCGRGPGHTHIFDERGVCWQCRQAREQAGLPQEAGRPLRPVIPCVRCGGRSLVRVTTMRERGVVDGSDYTYERTKPLALTYPIGENGKVASDQPIGVLEAYVCRTCGFTELYTKDAASIPIDEALGTEAFEVPDAGPFR